VGSWELGARGGARRAVDVDHPRQRPTQNVAAGTVFGTHFLGHAHGSLPLPESSMVQSLSNSGDTQERQRADVASRAEKITSWQCRDEGVDAKARGLGHTFAC
jgi:hypothetical protein